MPSRSRLRCYEQRPFHVMRLPGEVVDEIGTVAIPKEASKFDHEYQP